MADVWSPWVKNEFNFRCMLRYSTSTSADRVTASLEGWSQSAQTTISYGKSVLEWNEDGGAFTNLANVYPSALSYGATAHNSSASEWWTRVYGRDRHIYLQHWFSSPGSSIGEYVTGARAGATITIPARAYELPHAPASPSLVRDSDTSVTLAWKANYTSSSEAYPWTGVNVYRKVDGGSWSRIAQVSWDKTGYTDGGTSANHRYDYMVRSYNGSGESADAVCGTVYTTPSAPLAVTAERVSDSAQKVTWRLGDNAANAWEGVEVQRREDGGAWVALASLSESSVNYTDAGTSADHAYAYRVRSSNRSAASVWVESATVYTTPSAPKSVTASAIGVAAVSVSATGLSAIAEAFEVEHRVGASGEWGDATRPRSLPVDMPSSAGENFYRVRAVRGSLASAWTESDGVTTVARPKAPTVTGVSARYATGSEATVSWVPNHPDGSAQVGAQVELTDPTGKASVVGVSGAATSALTGALSKGRWSVRVRTRGAWAEGDGWGEWSQSSAFDVYDPPSVRLTVKSVVDRMPIETSWEISDETGVSRQLLQILDSSGEVVFGVELPAESRGAVIMAHNFLPENGGDYVLRLSVTGGSSLATVATAAFVVRWNAPAAPSAAVTAQGGSARVMVRFGSAEGLPETSNVSVYRRAYGADELLAEGLADGEEAIDRMAPLNRLYSYVLVAHSESTSQSQAVVPAFIDSGGCEAFSFGQDASACLLLGLGADVSHDVEHTGEAFHFALGRGSARLPTFYPDGCTSVPRSASYEVTDLETYLALDGIAADPANAVCWYRDHWGGRHRVRATWRLAYSSDRYGLWDVAASMTEVAWEDPIYG